MKVKFQLIDADYVMNNSKPVVRIFGKTKSNKSITLFYENFLPYFYVLPEEGEAEQIKKFIKGQFNEFLVDIENVEKFLPFGYQENPTKLLKIILNNPSKTPLIRDSLRKSEHVKNVYEADILFKYRFMADHGLYGMRWYEATGDYIRTKTTKTQVKFKAKTFKELDYEEHSKFKHMSFDIEAFSDEGGLPDPEKDQIILLSLFFYPAFNGKNTLVLSAKKLKKTKKNTSGFESEKEMLKQFLKIIDRYDPDILLGYNVNGFDIPYIEKRLEKNNLSKSIGRCASKPLFCRKFANMYKNSIVGRAIVDVYELVRASIRVGLFKGLKRYGLENVSRLVLGEGKVDVSHKQIKEFWNDNGKKLNKLIDYNRKDAELPLKILLNKKMLGKYLELCRVTGVTLQDALNSGEAARIENLVLRKFNRKNYITPCKPSKGEISKRNIERRKSGLKGAFVLEPDIGFHNTCVVYLDFKSMYPTIIQAFNICPTTLLLSEKNVESIKTPTGSKFVPPKIKKGIIPNILENLITTRDVIKKEMKQATSKKRKQILFAKQLALKITANAFYGYSGYLRAKLYVLEIASAITGTGRHMINKTKSIVENNTPYKVIYADTDSVMVKLRTKDIDESFEIGKELSKLINDGIDNILQIKIESIFKTLLILSKKRYVGWQFEPTAHGFDESVLMKGIETVRRDWCDLVSETLKKILHTIVKEQDVDKAIDIMKKQIDNIKSGKIDVDKLVITKGISRPINSYKGVQPHVEVAKKMKKRDITTAPKVGDRVSYVIVKGKQLLSKRAEDPDYIKKNNLPIDSKYYIENQLLPPLERVFKSLNINKNELLGIGRQLGILEAMKNNNKQEKEFEDNLTDIDGFICNNCNTVFKRVPLTGKCNLCDGEIVFFKSGKKSREYITCISPTSTN